MSIEIKCDACLLKYPEDSINRISGFKYLCKKCHSRREKIMDDRIGHKLIYDDYSLEVTYQVDNTDHDGDCGYPYNSVNKIYQDTVIYPLLKIFKQKDIDDRQKTIDLDNHKLIYYTIDNEGASCCRTYRTIIKAKVIITPPEITLDDDEE